MSGVAVAVATVTQRVGRAADGFEWLQLFLAERRWESPDSVGLQHDRGEIENRRDPLGDPAAVIDPVAVSRRFASVITITDDDQPPSDDEALALVEQSLDRG